MTGPGVFEAHALRDANRLYHELNVISRQMKEHLWDLVREMKAVRGEFCELADRASVRDDRVIALLGGIHEELVMARALRQNGHGE